MEELDDTSLISANRELIYNTNKSTRSPSIQISQYILYVVCVIAIIGIIANVSFICYASCYGFPSQPHKYSKVQPTIPSSDEDIQNLKEIKF